MGDKQVTEGQQMDIKGLLKMLSEFPDDPRARINVMLPQGTERKKRDFPILNTKVLFYLNHKGNVEDICVRGKESYNIRDELVWREVTERVAADNGVVFGASELYSPVGSLFEYFVSPLKEGADLPEEIRKINAAQLNFSELILRETDKIYRRKA